MFRLLRLKPPNGWNAVAWELGVVTLGVFIALAVQRWAEDRSWKSRAQDATAAFRNEVGNHYKWAVEWRMVEPCIIAQLDRLQQRLMASGDTLDPAPLYRDPAYMDVVIRMPSKDFDTSAWQSSISDGVSPHLDPAMRKELDAHYFEVRNMINLTARNDVDNHRLLALRQPVPLDEMVRFSLLQTLEELRGRTGFMALLSGQIIDHVTRVGMVPPADATRKAVLDFGTYKFCKLQGLPTRSVEDASRTATS